MAIGTDTSTDGAANGAFEVQPVLRPRQQVERQLKRAILTGVLAQGDRLPSETRLAEQFNVSRATIREALRSLAERGLITKSPGANGGSFVEYVDHHSLSAVLSERLTSTLELGSITYEEMSQFRDLLEVPSARLAAQNRSDAEVDRLEHIIDLEKATTVDDPLVDRYNGEFHCTIAEASGNRLLAAFVAALHAVTHPLTFVDTSPEVGLNAVKHHIAIVKAVTAQDTDAAADAMRQHLAYLRTHADRDLPKVGNDGA